MNSHEEIVKFVEENYSLTAPFEKALNKKMKFIKDFEGNWSQIEVPTNFLECTENTLSIGNVAKTGMCQTQYITHNIYSVFGEKGENLHKILSYLGYEVDKHNIFTNFNHEHHAMRMEQLAELLETKSEYVANLISLLF